ncbi:MAG: hypothetical protein QXU75_08680, partial [Candidatus Methanomethylicaceae archaeon]
WGCNVIIPVGVSSETKPSWVARRRFSPSPPAPLPRLERGELSACAALRVPPLPRRGRGGRG